MCKLAGGGLSPTAQAAARVACFFSFIAVALYSFSSVSKA